jgi:hypothetical protein
MRRTLSRIVLMTMAAIAVWSPGPAGARSAEEVLRFTEIFAGRNPDGTVVATGLITGVGRATSAGDVDIWVFPGKGTLAFSREVLSYTSRFDPASCTTTFSGVESFRLTGETGQLSGLTIAGSLTDRGTFVADRVPGGCSEDSGSVFVVVRGQGQAV